MLPKHGQGRPGIGHDADRDRMIHADLGGVEIDLNELPGYGHPTPVGQHFGEPAADGEHGVGMAE